jgi:hypothetical protein
MIQYKKESSYNDSCILLCLIYLGPSKQYQESAVLNQINCDLSVKLAWAGMLFGIAAYSKVPWINNKL